MKTIIKRTDLKRAVDAVYRAVPTRGPLPVLSYFQVNAADQSLTFVGTDLEIGITAVACAVVSEPGVVLIPAKTLADIVAKLPDVDVTIETDGSDVHIKAGKSKFKLRTMPGADFPELPTLGDDAQMTVFDAAALVNGLRHVSYAAASDDKAVICGVNFERTADGITLAATDGFKLSSFKLPGTGGEPFSIVVPRRAVDEIVRQLANIEGEIAVYRAGNQLVVQAGMRVVTTRLIDGVYPNYRGIIPATFERSCSISRQSLLDAVDRVSVLAGGDASIVQFDFGAEDVGVAATSSDIGNADETVVASLEGEPISIALNASFVTAILRATVGESVIVRMNGALNPLTIEVIGRSEWRGLMMPVNRV